MNTQPQSTNTTDTKEQKKQLIILRGISGSGKSTLAKAILKDNPNGVVFSTDDYFIDKKTGEYKFDPTLLGKAHSWNQRRAAEAMEKGISPVIIDNTNTQRWEAKPYVETGLKHGYEIVVREPQTPWAKNAEELAKKNKHNVPIESIRAMLARWEDDFSVEAILKSKPPKRRRGGRGRGRGGYRGGQKK